jgi:ribosomal-protein-alanine N-acetyltransferase
MIGRDMKEVLDIENQSFEYPWGEEDFLRCLHERDITGRVIEVDEMIVGFIVYRLYKRHSEILDIAVHRNFRRMGAGGILVQKVVRALTKKRTHILCYVSEHNLVAQIWLREMGFIASGKPVRDWYEYQDGTSVDAYRMLLRKEWATGQISQ